MVTVLVRICMKIGAFIRGQRSFHAGCVGGITLDYHSTCL